MKKIPPFPLLLLLFLSLAHSDTNPGDMSAMLDLADAIPALDWSPSSSPCTWKHVTCNSNRVTAIQIGNNNLTGSLPPSIGKLTALTRLELDYNQLTGPLPSSLGNLTSLQTLLLHNNRFTSVPPSLFSDLTSLESAYLDSNPFAPWEIPDSLKNCASLVNFSANSANVTGKVPSFFGDSFSSLNHLSLAFNSLEGSIPDSFYGSGIRALWLNNQLGPGLSGGIGFVSGMVGLEQLWLHSNAFSGPLPDFSNLTNLRDLQLRDNMFTGVVPKSLTQLTTLQQLTLTNNLLQGPVPVFMSNIGKLDLVVGSESFCLDKVGECDARVNSLLAIVRNFGYPVRLAQSWKGNDPCNGWLGITCDDSGNVTVVNFQKLGLNGTVPAEFSLIPSVQRILLSGNNLTGTIPKELAELPALKELDLSDNDISGEVPSFGKNVALNTDGNPNIGKIVVSPPGSPARNGGGSGSDPSGSGSGGSGNGGKSKSASVGVIVGSILAVLCVVSLAVFAFLYYRKKRQHFGRIQSPNNTVIHPRRSGSDPDAIKITVVGSSTNATAASMSDVYSPTSSRYGDVQLVESGNMVISIQVLQKVTNNFSEENILGRGGFGTVYKGVLHDGTEIAVKRMESGVMGSKGLTEFRSEISVLTKVRHRNLVSLLGYCLEGNERILVYEYMPQGTLSRHLFEWKEEGLQPLDWKKRLGIALDVARGVEYLHSLANQSFIHRDLKPSNILLGDDMKAKVADFGLVRLAPDGKGCSVETRLAGTFGYLAPEYAVTGRVTTKSDVFSFGVVLMELLTGRKALDETRPDDSMHLVTWFRRMNLNKEKTLRKSVVDPTLSTDADNEETLASINTVAELAGHCCAREPHQRPDMGHAVNVLASLADLWKPGDQETEDAYGIDLGLSLPQALKRWQGMDGGATSSGMASFLDMDYTNTSIATRPYGFAETFTSSDGR